MGDISTIHAYLVKTGFRFKYTLIPQTHTSLSTHSLPTLCLLALHIILSLLWCHAFWGSWAGVFQWSKKSSSGVCYLTFVSGHALWRFGQLLGQCVLAKTRSLVPAGLGSALWVWTIPKSRFTELRQYTFYFYGFSFLAPNLYVSIYILHATVTEVTKYKLLCGTRSLSAAQLIFCWVWDHVNTSNGSVLCLYVDGWGSYLVWTMRDYTSFCLPKIDVNGFTMQTPVVHVHPYLICVLLLVNMVNK